MSKYHDDRTAASDPGGMRLSVNLLRQIEPAFGEPRGADLDRDQHASRFLDRLDEHLQLGDARAACCVSVEPFLVAAYSDELDCVAMLRFPDSLVERLALVPGSRLLTVNTYRHEPEFAPDLLPGPRQLGRYSNVYPIIADFISEDRQRIAERKTGISEDEWRRCHEMGEEYLTAFAGRWRNGSPLHSWRPAQPVRPESAFPTKKSERLVHALICLFLLPVFTLLFVILLSVDIPADQWIALAVVVLIQEIALALVVYSALGLIWCLFMPPWLERLGESIASRMWRSVLLFAVGSFVVIGAVIAGK